MTIPWLPLFPDGTEPVTEVLGYPTSILTAESGREQRIRLRQHPSREFSMRMVEMRARESSRLLYALEQGHDFNCFVPFWPEAFQLTSDHVATDVTLNVDRTTERIEWFNQYADVVLWRGDGVHARYTITADAAGTIDVDPPLAEDWPEGSWLVPLWPCKLTQIGSIDRATDEAIVIQSLTARLDWGLARRNARSCEWIDALGGANAFANPADWTEETSLGVYIAYRPDFPYDEGTPSAPGVPYNTSPPPGNPPRLWGSDPGDYKVGPNGATSVTAGSHLSVSQFVLFNWNDNGAGGSPYGNPNTRDVWRKRVMTGLIPGTKVGMRVKIQVSLNGNDNWKPFMRIVGVTTAEWSGHLTDSSFWNFQGGFYEPTVSGLYLSAIVPPSGIVEWSMGVANMSPTGNIVIDFEDVEFAQCIIPVAP